MAGWGSRTRTLDGAISMDTSYRAGRYIGTVDTNATDGSISVAGFSQGEPIYKVLSFSDALSNVVPIVSFSGNTMSWSYGGAGNRAAARIVYGVR